ncbi:transglutaminase domain-containing protein [Zavarzinia sp.]|uniref:transglutaminase family protein n=1 Tax=Zavarzinia sp. TaxID=2027920 RepID=UPI003564783D
MRFSVRHETLYSYSVPIRLAPHVLRMTPRALGTANLRQELIVDPLPWRRSDVLDRFGNPMTLVDFSGDTDRLGIVSHFEVETRAVPRPADDGSLPPLPWSPLGGDLAEYLLADDADWTVRAFAIDIANAAGNSAPGFLDLLNRTLFARTDRHIRIEGAAQSPAHTLASARGACRDLSVLFMAACRSQGIPARFVSGYQAEAESVDGRRHLHAWPEVFLPGLGWIGYDPTHGLPVGEGHVALSAAPNQAETMPVEGGFYANGVTATLTYSVTISTGA